MNLIQKAYQLRKLIEKASVAGLNDEDALTGIELFPVFEKLVENGETVERGFRFRYGEKLYRIEQPTYTFVSTYVPGQGTESLFSEVSLETEGDSINNPIAYNNNMELFEGKYYKQDNVVYICFRSTGVPVYNPLNALVELYVRVATE